MNANGRWSSGATVRIRGERWIVLHQSVYEGVSALDVRGIDAANGGHTARFLLPFEPIESINQLRTPRVVRPAEWRVRARATLAEATPGIDSLRAAARSRLDILPYQLEPVLAVVRGHGCRVLIADEVGLGKTVQAALIVAEMLQRQPDGRALVVCPAGLRAQWQEELRVRFGLESTLLDAAEIARRATDFDVTVNPWSVCRLIITSIDFVKRAEVTRALEGSVWDVIVFDEAHNLSTRSDRATAAAALAWRARIVVMLSATPHSGDDRAFARLCGLGDANGRFPLQLFRRTRTDAAVAGRRRTRWLSVRPTIAETHLHAALIDYARGVWNAGSAGDAAKLAMSVLLKRAASSATSLARSVERRLASISEAAAPPFSQLGLPFADSIGDDEEPTLSIVEPGLADVDEERRQLEHLLSLARLAAVGESKVAALQRWLARVREPVLVFTEYRDTLSHLRRTLMRDGFSDSIAELHGGSTRAERDAAKSSFVHGHTRVLLATDAASEGLNLHQRCRCVINLEVPWSPVRLEQRIGRVDRIGQQHCVHAINMIAAGTPEMTTVRRLVERERRAAGALGANAVSDMATAEAAITGLDLPDHRPMTLPAALNRPDLRAEATSDAGWIETARRLDPGRVVMSRRPFVAKIGRVPKRLVWIAELAIRDADDVLVWSELIALEVRAPLVWEARDIATAADALERLGLTQRLARHATDRAMRALQDATGTAVDRERAICAAVRLRHARLAADLVQPGLFDRRAERRAASQASVLEETLDQCQTRLDALARLTDLKAGPLAFRFAVLA